VTTGGVLAALDLTGRVAVITGGAGLLGVQHASAIAEMGGVPVLVDLDGHRAAAAADDIAARFNVAAAGFGVDCTDEAAVEALSSEVQGRFGRLDILINNAAHNPTMSGAPAAGHVSSRLEHYSLELWRRELEAGLTTAFLCSRTLGSAMAAAGRGVILNIASDLGVIAPDQRLYRRPDLPDEQQPVKPVTYSVVKHGVIGLTRYLSTYWADRGVRVNSLSPGGVLDRQDPAFVERISRLIPLGRLAHVDEYRSVVVFLVSDASSYMTGANVIMDGGRTAW
jgi:NAD(P)-dependent dehydrogenase (short-subunit alcohol dehydrogenase family)